MAQQHHAYDQQWWGWSDDAVEIWRRGFFLDKPNEAQMVAVEGDGKVIGFVRGRVAPNPPILRSTSRGAVWDIYVLPRCRPMGVEAALMEAIMGEFRRRGAQEVTVPVAWINKPAMEIYEKLGLRPVVITMYGKL
jgi:ribosomal protein S18 acetylase RimI-like enzyme